MTDVVLVGVHDSPASMAAADVAIAHAAAAGAALRAVAVVERAGAASEAVVREREQACAAALAHIARAAAEAGVSADVTVRHGRVAAELLAEAVACGATLVVVGRMDRPGHVIPAIGSHTLGVVEFAHVPVLVVPEAAPDRSRGPR